MALLEICVDDAQGLLACIKGGADRIELCSSLTLGGLTPSLGLMQLAAKYNVPVFAMIRPRAGNFCFSDNELDIMCDDIAAAAGSGLAGVVLGVANDDQTLNVNALKKLSQAAVGMGKTLHRVMDTLTNQIVALDQIIDLGFDQVLTSGGKPGVDQGLDMLVSLQDRAQGRIDIMAGAGLTPPMVSTIHQRTGIEMFHASCRRPVKIGEPFCSLGFASPDLYETDVNLIRQYKRVLAELAI
ncbi:MAG: copper homeostasis protein [Granulosicoccus sp.]|jgi:copper homeostasis protein